MGPEKDIIESLKGGDKNAMKAIFNLYHRSLWYFAKQIISNNEQTEEIVADAFIKLWQKNADFDALAEIKFFLFMIVRQSCSNYSQQLPQREGSDTEMSEPVEKDENYIESKMIKAGVLQIFLEEIDKLPPLRQKIFKMSFVDELSIFEIAEQLQVTVDTVRVQKAKALHSISSAMLKKDI